MSISVIVGSIVTNYISSEFYDGKLKVCERIKLWRFKKELTDWTRQYINKHDGSVLTTGDFEIFLTKYHLIEKIFEHVISAETSESKDEFVANQIKRFHSMQSNKKANKYDTDALIKGFIEYFYKRINSYYLKNLSQNEKYITSKIVHTQNEVTSEIKSVSKCFHSDLLSIKETLKGQSEINDPEQLWMIYKALSQKIVTGNVNEVKQIESLLIGKSEDLENSIAFLIKLFTDEQVSFGKLRGSIVSQQIYDDVCRIAIYVSLWREKDCNLSEIITENTELADIIIALKERRKDSFYIIEKSKTNGITIFTYKMELKYPNEEWLVRRIVALEILKSNVANAADSVKEIIQGEDNIIDRILLLDRMIAEAYSTNSTQDQSNRQLFNEASDLVLLSDILAKDIKGKLYGLLLKSALLISNFEAENVIESIPEELLGSKDIDMFSLEVKIRNGSASVEDIMSVCMKHDEYWLFNNYLVENANADLSKAKEIIEEYRFVIDKEPAICLIYSQLINKFDGPEKAITFLNGYQEKYGKYVEFWIDKLQIEFNDEELNRIIDDYNNDKFEHLSREGYIAFVQLMITNKKFKEALSIINTFIDTGKASLNLLKLKAVSLLNLNLEIESLAVYLEAFKLGGRSEDIIYYILALSLNNRRKVPEKVLSIAENSKNPQILTCVASIYVGDNKIEQATLLNRKALLYTKDEVGDAYNQCVGLETVNANTHEVKLSIVDIETVAYLRTENGNQIVYAIHAEKVLPDEPFNWGNAKHIYKETAISLHLYRKKIGEVISINNENYKIIDVIALRSYFFRLSMDKVVKKGEAAVLEIPSGEDGTIDINKFAEILQQTVGDDNDKIAWLEQYKDLSQIPVTFFIGKRYVRVTYFQLISLVLNDPEIIFREEAIPQMLSGTTYVFTYAALVALFSIGWKPSDNNKKFCIPKALKKIIYEEIEEIIRNNSQDHVSYMGINDGNFYMIETDEADKHLYMEKAVEFKAFCDEFYVVDNQQDLHLETIAGIDVKKILGIADYDALMISKNENRILVTAELMVTGIAQIPEIQNQSVCIADFVTNVSKNIDELIGYISRMVKFKFIIPFTMASVLRLSKEFENANSETRKGILNKWEEILDYPEDNQLYNQSMIEYLKKCIAECNENETINSAIVFSMCQSCLKHLKQKVIVSLGENGLVKTEIVSLDKVTGESEES